MARITSPMNNYRDKTGYLPIEHYGLIGNMRTCALVGIDGSIDFMCWYDENISILTSRHFINVHRPDFDSPSVFCRLLDKDKGGFFSITPAPSIAFTTKQQYLPSTNILQTRYISEEGVVDVVDFFPRPRNDHVVSRTPKQMPYREAEVVQGELKKWLVRRVECIRGTFELSMSTCILGDRA